MTDFIDLIFSPSQIPHTNLTVDQVYAKHHFSKYMEDVEICHSMTSIMSQSEESHQAQCYEKTIPFLNIQIWHYRLILTIKHFSTCQICTEIKILTPQGEVLKVVSQYHKTFLYQKFLQKNSIITPKINPQTGQISLCHVFFLYQFTSHNQYENIVSNLMASIQELREQITEIINLVQNHSQQNIFNDNQSSSIKVPTFLRLCSKKSDKQNFIPFQNSQIIIQARKQVKCLTYGGTSETSAHVKRPQRINRLKRYLNNQLESINQIWEYENLSLNNSVFKDQVRKIMGNVQNSMIRTNTCLKSYETINLPQKQIEKLIKSISTMKTQRKSKRVTIIQKSGLGKVTVQIELHRMSTVQKTHNFLSILPPQVQLSFVNNYFSCNDLLQSQQSKEIIIQLAIRRQELLSYLKSNSQCISFSTKLRILSQLISSAHLLEQKCSTMMTRVEMENFFIAKNMMVKINNLKYLKYLNHNEQKQLEQSIKMGFVENQVNISRIYSKIFYQKDLIYVKPTQNVSRIRLSHVLGNSRFEQKQIIVDKIYEECGLYGPKKLMTMLTCLFLPYIPMMSFQDVKKHNPCKNLKYGIASLVKILENIN